MPDLDDLGDLVDEAKDLVGDHKGDVKKGIDAAAGVADQLGVDKKTARSVAKTAKEAVDSVPGGKPRKRKPAKKKAT